MDYKPEPYQQYCIEQVIARPNIALWLGMSMGKTSITLTAIERLMFGRLEVGKVLIVAPKRVTLGTWQAEAKKWNHLSHLRMKLIQGTPAQRTAILSGWATDGTHIHIVSRDMLWWVVDYFGRDWPYDMVVLDEASSFKSWKSRRFKKMKLVKPKVKRIVELTGTPSPKSYEDIWSQIDLLEKGRLGKNITAYRNAYFSSYMIGGITQLYKLRPECEKIIQDRIADLVVCMKTEDYVNLPPIIYHEERVFLDGKTQKLYQRMEREAFIPLIELDAQQEPDKKVYATTQAAVSNKLLQLCNGAVYDEEKNVHQVHTAKLERLMEMLEELTYQGRNVLLFYQFQFDIDTITAAVDGKYRFRMLKNSEDEADWNAGKIQVLLAHPASCAYGLNLQYGGADVIWYGLTDNLELFEQANERTHRRDAERPTEVHMLLLDGGRDEDVLKRLTVKGAGQEALRQSLKARKEALGL